MPFLVLIAIYAARIMRSPLDTRLKKSHVGPLTVAALFVVLSLAWDWLRPDGIGTVYFLGEFCGVSALYLMTWALVLATRLRWLEQWFGGLDRMYRCHKNYALWSILLLVPHSVFADTEAGRTVRESPQAVGLGRALGLATALGLLVLVLVSLARVGRILRLPHERWLVVHRLIGLLVVSSLVHGWVLDHIIGRSSVLKIVYVVMGVVGTAAYAYDELVMRRRVPRADYTVHAVKRPAPDIVDLTLAPAGHAPLQVKGGQFVYLRVGGHRAWREHPLSVAGVQHDGCVRLTVRAVGRGTRRLYADLREGALATLSGPYGMFDHTVGGQRQIWIAGGIGIAPFLGWITHEDAEALPSADLFYCTSTATDAPFLPELTEAARRHPALRLHSVYSRRQGRLTVDKILAATGPLTPDTHVFLCGPASMVENLTIALRGRGISRHHLHAEHFAFR
ncbi:ferredoxin reductase family protein [Streptomyces griseorubiginosus]|uniref:ferredoxin reductase family protein n=1 Tax=Streptomyces griseorubiginosus TaxID=67304 RepID=UPI002E817323|nr:ferredoxin reductase family protein [Streptomyces griseorubiginosus]WUB42659.1 ferredoxin reductase family protein [Streptomyces griseorubiginosus]WUB51178.1 ferredoxin reductase family protein [Streptomyces griseorubiginosus]